jgi:hypothetical protein
MEQNDLKQAEAGRYNSVTLSTLLVGENLSQRLFTTVSQLARLCVNPFYKAHEGAQLCLLTLPQAPWKSESPLSLGGS